MGYNVIPNVRWSDAESYKYAFAGIRKNSIVAIGTLGCTRLKQDYVMFIAGFAEMIKQLSPRFIVIYGSCTGEMVQMMVDNNIQYRVYQSQISKAYEVKKNGNEG